MRAMLIVSALVAAALAASPGRAAGDTASLLILPFGFFDTSGEPRDQKAEHVQRLAAMADELQSKLKDSGLYRLVSVPGDPAPCPAGDTACLLGRAKSAGADLVLTGAVQKVSTMASDLWVGAFDTASGQRVFYRQLTFRGDTDDAWRHATRFLFHQIESDPPKRP